MIHILINKENYMTETWDKIMSLRTKDTRHKGVANTLTDDEIETIIATMDFFGADYRQTVFDLKVARYRVFDWLAMAVQGRESNQSAIKVLAHSFIKVGGDINAFVDDLRVTDYDIDHSWEKIEL
jgi:uncharacterized ubiquitin-like protein YukD